MSTAIPAGAPAPVPEAPAPAKEIRHPLLWLLVILALGLVVRGLHFRSNTFQIDEFTSLAAVAERQGLEVGVTPTDKDPLVPVPSLGEVSNRSVIPFGIQDPVPLYHDMLWAIIHVLPPADWSLRLLSLVAGVGCIAAVYFLVRGPFGNEMALVAALFVALDPIQIATSWLARPYALANLFTVLSFAALWGLLQARTPAKAALLAVAYGVCVALIGYLNALLLFVIAAHLGMVLYALRGDAAAAAHKAAGYWLAGVALGLVLLAPEIGYFYRVSAFAIAHADYLKAVNDIHLLKNGPLPTLFFHNLLFIGGLVLVMAAGAVVRMQLQGGGSEQKPEGESTPLAADAPSGGTATALTAAPPAGTAVAPAAAPTAAAAPPAPLPENDDALRMARFWLFLPQAALLFASLLVSAIFFTRFMTYTTIGAAILLAYYATRDGSREVRLGVAGAVALALLVVGFWDNLSSGNGLFSPGQAQKVMGVPDREDREGGLAGITMNKGAKGGPPVWKEGDVVLMRSGHIESDLLYADIPEATRPQVERVLLAPLTLLYPDATNKPVIALSLSQYRNDKLKNLAGDKAPLDTFYNADLVARLKKYKRYWMTGMGPSDTPNNSRYLACVVPWMATQLDRGDLVVARDREGPEHYVVVKPNLGPDEPIKGLTDDVAGKDYGRELHIVKAADAKK